MTKNEMINVLKTRLEIAQMNGRNEGIGKKGMIFHQGKAEAYTDAIKMLEQLFDEANNK